MLPSVALLLVLLLSSLALAGSPVPVAAQPKYLQRSRRRPLNPSFNSSQSLSDPNLHSMRYTSFASVYSESAGAAGVANLTTSAGTESWLV
ncbi:hypothetical protein BZA70DRAFT_283102 [Myxozyma melibiosi]|uniref:Uncharacterized protein n=1 Tax=Myxozyma melibiosi TaxID=54550 RepID=A0ABR1F1E9_9ASCO